MNDIFKISLEEWERLIKSLSASNNIFAPVRKEGGLDYSLINRENAGNIVYNEAKPASPLKIFFLPVKLNVTIPSGYSKKTIIIGAPACDIEALKLLDKIYLDDKLSDGTYLERRSNCLIISNDCYIIQEHCHCTTYGITPHSPEGCDINLASDKEYIYLESYSDKGSHFIKENIQTNLVIKEGETNIKSISGRRDQTIKSLSDNNKKLPGTEITGESVKYSSKETWKKYSSKCVSCGACSAICPTCTCFLLIDKPDFEKVKQLDTCQYPAFERVAGGEDPLKELSIRFKNRYMCKYIWKPERFHTVACTGCGRCIEACIAKISKNELITELQS